jgi:hypothetical protein
LRHAPRPSKRRRGRKLSPRRHPLRRSRPQRSNACRNPR